MRHAVIGDVGAHLGALRHELERLGADPDAGVLPDDLTVVQVGDLVHRGPDSEAVVALVDRFLGTSGGRWVQLVGNHEAQYLRHPAFHWRNWIATESADVLRGWWARGEMVAAAVLPSSDGDVLVTHAGVTEEFWRRDLAQAQTATAAAALLNDMAAHGDNNLFRSGMALTGGRANFRAGPLWAAAAGELVASWQGRTMPFNQVHGHSSCYDWTRGTWRRGAPVESTTLDLDASHETTLVGGRWIVGVDPDHGGSPRTQWCAWQPPA